SPGKDRRSSGATSPRRGVQEVPRTRECPADHAVVPRCAAAVARGAPWDSGPRHHLATAQWASDAPEAAQSMLCWSPRLWAHGDPNRDRRWTCPAEYTAEKATGAVAPRAARAASWLHQLGHVAPDPTTLGGQSCHASSSSRWSGQTGTSVAEW